MLRGISRGRMNVRKTLVGVAIGSALLIAGCGNATTHHVTTHHVTYHAPASQSIPMCGQDVCGQTAPPEPSTPSTPAEWA